MSDLRGVFTGLGLRDVRSPLNSGNLVFAAGRRGNASLERVLEREILRRLDLEATAGEKRMN